MYLRPKFKKRMSIFLCCVLLLYLFGCMTEDTCKQLMNYRSNMAFNLVVEGPTTTEDNYYEIYAKDLTLDKYRKIKIDRGLAGVIPHWSKGDTLIKNIGNTIIFLKKKKPVLGTRIFISEWNCNGGLINGRPADEWINRSKRAGYSEDFNEE